MKILNKNIIRILTIFLLFTLLSGLAGCNSPRQENNGKIHILCTVFPVYDWTRAVVGDSDLFEIELLVSNGGDMHSYQPSASDIAKISQCDLFIYVGGESDAWAEQVLEQTPNEERRVLHLMNALEAEGLLMDNGSGEHTHNHEEHAHLDEEEANYDMENEEHHHEIMDEHIWMSLSNASYLVSVISREILNFDPDGNYTQNTERYQAELERVDAAFQNVVEEGRNTTLVVADRFPYRYLLRDYGLDYCAAYEGCSAETEASFDIIIEMAQKADELEVQAICVTENSDLSLAETVVDNCNAVTPEICVLHSLQAVSWADIQEGNTYIGYMEENVSALALLLQ